VRKDGRFGRSVVADAWLGGSLRSGVLPSCGLAFFFLKATLSTGGTPFARSHARNLDPMLRDVSRRDPVFSPLKSLRFDGARTENVTRSA